MFCKFDIKEYFLTGDPLFLADTAASHFDGQEATFIKNATFFVLTHQYVECNLGGEPDFYRICKGSGMGLPHSGALSDLVLASIAEKELDLERFLIKGFFRFRDDVVGIFQDRELMGAFGRKYIKDCKPYVVLCEQVASDSIDFLEVTIAKDIRHRKFLVSPRIKPTSLGSFMLSDNSMHSPHTLRAWPIGYMSKRLSLCNTAQAKSCERDRILRKFREECFPPSLIAKLEKVGFESQLPVQLPRARTVFSWLVLPYHPLLRGISSRLACWSDGCSLLGHNGLPNEIRVAWRNESRNLHALVSSALGGNLGLVGGFNKK